MSQHFTETCPANLIHCELNRQAGARINLDPNMAAEFRVFSDWFNAGIIDQMK